MNNSSLAAQAVATGPATVAPPSFDGHGWLVVVNLAGMTAVCILAVMFAIATGRAIWRNRGKDLRRHPVTIWRLASVCFACGIALRCGGEALALWNWNPLEPAATGWFLTLKRFIDPFALAFGMAGLGLSYLAAPGLVTQLRKTPLTVKLWASLPMLRRPAAIVALSLIAAIGVVSTR